MQLINLRSLVVLLAACAPSSSSIERRCGRSHGCPDASVGVDSGDPSNDSATSADGARTSGVGPYFQTPMFFNRDVSTVTKASYSDTAIAALRAEGGWGNGDSMQIDFSLDVLVADATTPHRAFVTTDAFYTPDCDHVDVPIPAGGNVEGEPGYACTGDGDCHLLVHDRAAGLLYEMWRANLTSTTFEGGCLAVWNEPATYPESMRGDQCTSADAAGLPISPLLFTADEVASGTIDHAIRFILPNDRVTRGFVRPATHATSTTGISGAPAYGVHLRLRADFPLASLPDEGARTIARAMQKYGMYHADGGNIALTAQSDRHTTHKWSGLLGPRDLSSLRVEDFEVIDHGSTIPLTYDCARN